MRRVTVKALGGPEQLVAETAAEASRPGPGQVLTDVKATTSPAGARSLRSKETDRREVSLLSRSVALKRRKPGMTRPLMRS
ncbi:MAG: hypothetical protein JWR25_798 [Noviherbaspirillum sp.]|nr:hypothetical protein [Noviherbaspirillum sp.]